MSDPMLMFVHPAFLGSLMIVGAFTYSGLSFQQAKNDDTKSQRNKDIGIGSGSLVFGVLLAIGMYYYLKEKK